MSIASDPIEALSKTYPSVELGYPIAVASFDVAQRRLDVLDGRIQTIMAFVVTVSAAVPSMASARGVSFWSGWSLVAVTLFAASMVVGTYARMSGKLKVLDPSVLFDYWLHKPEWEFKKDMISFAGEAFDHNLSLIERKWKCTVVIIWLFFAQAAAMAAWVVAGNV